MNFSLIDGGVCAPRGFQSAGVHCGLKATGQRDLALIFSTSRCQTAVSYTQNKLKGAPLLLTAQHLRLSGGISRAVLCNSGRANGATAHGVDLARQCSRLLADALAINHEEIILASTGRLDLPLALAPFQAGIPLLKQELSALGNDRAAAAIMTTDRVPKQRALTFALDGHSCTIGAMAKGSGQVNPNLATMLAFITSDVAIEGPVLREIFRDVVAETFNQLSIDGDCSCNDMAVLMCNGQSEMRPIAAKDSPAGRSFHLALRALCIELVRDLARDGASASKLIQCEVSGAPTLAVARAVAKQVIGSTAVKGNLAAAVADWPGIVAAVGASPGDFPVDRLTVAIASEFGQLNLYGPAGPQDFDGAAAAKILSSREIDVLVNLQGGSSRGWAWGCDRPPH